MKKSEGTKTKKNKTKMKKAEMNKPEMNKPELDKPEMNNPELKKQEMKKPAIVVVLLLEMAVFIAVFIFTIMMGFGVQSLGYSVSYFVDIPSLLMILLCVAPALLVTGMGKDFVHAFSIGKKKLSLRELKKCLEAVKMVQLLAICGAAFSGTISFCALLYNMNDLSSIGPSLAIITLSAFYATLLEFLLIPLKAHVQNAITEVMGVEDEEA